MIVLALGKSLWYDHSLRSTTALIIDSPSLFVRPSQIQAREWLSLWIEYGSTFRPSLALNSDRVWLQI